jgi:uncharacterized protein YaiE (UPF0345 family)
VGHEEKSTVSEFKNVSVVKKANVYFGGGVTSRTLRFSDGTVKTLGFMQPGEYEFNTGEPEIMEIMSGALDVLLPGTQKWTRIKGGQSFEVPGSAKFSLKVIDPTDYCCSFIRQ